MPDPQLVQKVDSLGATALAVPFYRLMSSRYPPVSGEGARQVGGRWNPPDSFPTLYLASSEHTAVEEVRRAFKAQGRSLADAVGLVVYEFDVRLSAVLDLRDEADLAKVGLSTADVRALDRSLCQAVGDAAHFVGLEGVWAQSGAGPGEVLAVFTDNQQPSSLILPGRPTQWP